jgi:hypothetical protein
VSVEVRPRPAQKRNKKAQQEWTDTLELWTQGAAAVDGRDDLAYLVSGARVVTLPRGGTHHATSLYLVRVPLLVWVVAGFAGTFAQT